MIIVIRIPCFPRTCIQLQEETAWNVSCRVLCAWLEETIREQDPLNECAISYGINYELDEGGQYHSLVHLKHTLVISMTIPIQYNTIILQPHTIRIAVERMKSNIWQNTHANLEYQRNWHKQMGTLQIPNKNSNIFHPYSR